MEDAEEHNNGFTAQEDYPVSSYTLRLELHYNGIKVGEGISCVEGVDNLLDIQPHEYGLLRLKYGLTEGNLFLPSYVKNILLEN